MADILSYFVVLFTLQSLSYAKSESSSEPDTPGCVVVNLPPRVFMTFRIPASTDSSTLTHPKTYTALYCHPSKSSKWCRRPPKGYIKMRDVKQTETTKFIKHNMTDVVWKLYPNMVDPHKVPTVKGKVLHLVVSVTYLNSTTYSKRKRCNVLATKCLKLKEIQVRTAGEGQLEATYYTPSGMDAELPIHYQIYYSAPGDRENKTVFNLAKGEGPHHTKLKYLQPNTQITVYIGCSFLASLNDDTQGEVVKSTPVWTLPEPPSEPPIIERDEIIENGDNRTVLLEWKHPPVGKRHGNITMSLVSYWIADDNNTIKTSHDAAVHNVTVKGLKTQAYLQNINPFTDYFVTVQSCISTKKCSEPSVLYRISRRLVVSARPEQSTKGYVSWMLPVIFTVAGILFVPVVVGSAILVYKRSKTLRDSRSKRHRLPQNVSPHTLEAQQLSPVPGNDNEYSPPIMNEPESSSDLEYNEATGVLQENHAGECNHNKQDASNECVPLVSTANGSAGVI